MTIRSQSLYKPLDDTPAGVNGPSVRIDHDRLRPTRKIKTHVIFKTTDRLSESEQEQMRDLFLRVFDKKMTKNTFDRKFFCTPRGYSHHSLMLREQTVVGAFSAVPGRYKHFGQELIFSLSVDTMIDSEHRDGVHLMTMANRLHQGLIRDGIPFIFGFPNELFYPVQKKLLKYTDIGELDYYVLPLNIGAVAKKLKPLSGISRAICRCATRLSRVPRDSDAGYNIEKVADRQFERHRYDGSYTRIGLGQEGECIYRICEEKDGIQTLYIIDVVPLTRAFLARAVKQICRTAARAADIIIYVGRMPSRPVGLWKVPDSKKPQRIRMTGKILIPELVDSSVLDMENWGVNIADFDVR